MSVNDGIDPRLLFHVEDESLRFRVGDSVTKTRELETFGDRGFGVGISGIRQVFSGENDGVSVLIQPGTAATESKNPVREDEEEKLWNGKKVCNSHNKKQSKREKVNHWESLKSILSDPVTGVLMNDATILPCGHSFGAGGLKEVKRMKACFTCSQPTSEGSEKPNLSLRIVVHAFRQEQESDHIPSVKRRKERSDQHKRSFCNQNTTETPKSSSRGIQFPFSIGDHIIIEGNKRTPPRFVGRKAVIMTHCLNGWYVVKTVDNAESIKLQHCSLAKISDNSPAKVTVAEMAPSWL